MGNLKNSLNSAKKDQDGQTFIEFLLIFFVLITISFGVLAGFNRSIGDQWRAIVRAIALPNDTDDFEL